MTHDILIPPAGESVSSATLSCWHKQEGDWVEEGELLASLETDKVSQELLAPYSGFLSILVPENTDVSIGQRIATLAQEPSSPLPAPATPSDSSFSQKTSSSPAKLAPEAKTSSPTFTPPSLSAPPERQATTASPHSPLEAPSVRTSRQKMSPLRQKIAKQLLLAQQNTATLTTFNECDMSSLITLRNEFKEPFQKRYGVKLGFMSFFIKACVSALKEVPALNAKIEGTDIVTHHFYDISIAIQTKKGLTVPVLRDCDQKTCAELEQELAALAQKARQSALTLDDLQGGVFTLSNGGVYGSLLSTPLLNPPQSGILGMHTIQERPVVVDHQIVIRPMMYLALSYDHRLIDGKQAVSALVHIKQCLENPLRLLIET